MSDSSLSFFFFFFLAKNKIPTAFFFIILWEWNKQPLILHIHDDGIVCSCSKARTSLHSLGLSKFKFTHPQN